MRIAVVSLLLLVAAAPPPAMPAYRTFGRWIVACDNTRTCEARGFDETSAADLRVLRNAGNARPSLILSTAETPPDGSAIRLDGAPLPLLPPAWTRGDASPGNPAQLSTDDPKAVRAFLARTRDGHSLQLGGPDNLAVPLDGLVAALLFMDAAQGRAGTAAPLVAPAGPSQPLPPLSLPRPPAWQPPSRLSAAEMRSLLARARTLPSPTKKTCNQTEAPDAYPLDAQAALVFRPCEMFAYQGTSLVYVLLRRGGGPARPVALLLPGLPKSEAGPQGPDMMEPSFNLTTGQLSTIYKGRGPADCGLAASWVWQAGAFRLLSHNFQDQCGGADPGDWPTLYRSVGIP